MNKQEADLAVWESLGKMVDHIGTLYKAQEVSMRKIRDLEARLNEFYVKEPK